jgi:hypothetical protein
VLREVRKEMSLFWRSVVFWVSDERMESGMVSVRTAGWGDGEAGSDGEEGI